MAEKQKCKYCRQRRTANSDYERQNITTDEWTRLCWMCANKALRNPYTGLLGGFRRIPTPATPTEQADG